MSLSLKPTILKLHEDAEGRLVDIPVSKLPHGLLVVAGVEVTARDPCPTHGYAHHPLDNEVNKLTGIPLHPKEIWDPFPDCKGGIVGDFVDDFDRSVLAFLGLLQTNIFALTSASITDTGNTVRTVNANQATTAPTVVAGTGSTAPALADYKLQSQSASTSGTQAGTINAISTNTFTVTATITNSSGSTITYAELGMTVVNSTWTFLIAHDTINSGTGFPVSNGGNMSCTYTLTAT